MADDQTDDTQDNSFGDKIGLTHDQIMALITQTQAVPQPKAPKPAAQTPFQPSLDPLQSQGGGLQSGPSSGGQSSEKTASLMAAQQGADASRPDYYKQMAAQSTPAIYERPPSNQQPQGMPGQQNTAQQFLQALRQQNPNASPQQIWETMKAAKQSGMFGGAAQGRPDNSIEGRLYEDALSRGLNPQQAAEEAAKYKRAGAAEAAATTTAKKEAEGAVKIELAQPKAKATMELLQGNADDASKTIDTILGSKDKPGQVSEWTTGFMGSMMKHVPGSAAFDLSANLEKLQSRLGLDTLQELKNNSPNGSALGRVTNYEMGILVKAKENLEQAQSESQFIAALEDLKIKVANSRKHVQEAYEETYGAGKQAPTSENAADTAAPKTVNWSDL